MIAETERCVLREWTAEDAAFLYALNNNPEVLKYTGDEPFKDLDEARNFIESYDQYQINGFGRWLVELKSSGKAIGWSGLRKVDSLPHVDIGFRYLQELWGKGLATEVALKTIDLGFHKYGLESIMARAAVDNPGSCRVLEKIGMSQTGTDDCHGLEAIHYIIHRSDYQKI